MNNPLGNASIVGGPILIGLYLVAAAVTVILLARRPTLRRLAVATAAVLGGALIGWLVAWLVSDVWNLYGISFSVVTRLWIAAFFAGSCLALVSLFRSRWWRKGVAILAIPVFLVTAAAGINADFGAFTTLNSALGIGQFSPLDPAPVQSGVPSAGTVGSVTIPATVSGFAARPGLVYLPPVARIKNPPALPVVIMLSGQPGSPDDIFTSGRLASIFNAYAASHNGYAPIVVVPDQLGSSESNPMCVDSPLGNSATYLTVDVPAWIRAHLHVTNSPTGWALAGFSEGATCTLQLGGANPELFGTLFAISSELVPQQGSIANTIKVGFGGSAQAFAEAAPSAIFAAHAPYADMKAIFAVGENDARYLPWAKTLNADAAQAGMKTELLISPGTAHDWHTVIGAWTTALPQIAIDLGLPGAE
jgi:enterochelin esterase-like enzyme